MIFSLKLSKIVYKIEFSTRCFVKVSWLNTRLDSILVEEVLPSGKLGHAWTPALVWEMRSLTPHLVISFFPITSWENILEISVSRTDKRKEIKFAHIEQKDKAVQCWKVIYLWANIRLVCFPWFIFPRQMFWSWFSRPARERWMDWSAELSFGPLL